MPELGVDVADDADEANTVGETVLVIVRAIVLDLLVTRLKV